VPEQLAKEEPVFEISQAVLQSRLYEGSLKALPSHLHQFGFASRDGSQALIQARFASQLPTQRQMGEGASSRFLVTPIDQFNLYPWLLSAERRFSLPRSPDFEEHF